jgi:3-phosphoshikimate 1-carboxyvinyltransferase
MAFLVMGLAAERAVAIDDGETINTSFPGFVALMNGLGATIKAAP